MEIIKGATPTAPKLLLYGMPGSGKSSLAAKLDKPLFIDIEGGINFLDVPRTKRITSLAEFYSVLEEIGKNRNTTYKDYNTIVIDSVDWLVRLMIEKAAGITMANWEATLNKANGGYGNGKQALVNLVRSQLLPYVSRLNQTNMGICFIAHADQKMILDSDGDKTETIAPKIDVDTMNVFVEWVDFVYYLKKKPDGERTLLLDSDGIALAKNRIGLSGEVSLNDHDIKDLLIAKKEAK